MSKIIIILLLFAMTSFGQIKWENVGLVTSGIVVCGVADYVLYNELKDGDLSVYRYVIQPAIDLLIGGTLYWLTDDIKVSLSYGLMRLTGCSDLVYYACYGGFGNDIENKFKHFKYFIPFTSERSLGDVIAWGGMGISITIFLNQK